MIKLILDIYYSRTDRYGNSYWAFMLTDVRTGRSIAAKLGGSARSNAESMLRSLGYEWGEFHYTEHELPIRQFNAKVKSWPYVYAPDGILALFRDEHHVTLPRPARR